mgnify:CR=1 FL=1
MTANERFEIAAAVFYRRTGLLAPGKDQSPAAARDNDAERTESWNDFQAVYGEVIRMTIAECEADEEDWDMAEDDD